MKYPLGAFGRLIANDILRTKRKRLTIDDHRNAAIDWLCLAHDKADGHGVSYGYSVRGGWKPPYRETTGYIAVTFFDLADRYGRDDLKERAIRMCDWEITSQNADGSISNPSFEPDRGIVFDTGQVLFGLVRAYEKTGADRFRSAAIRAGNWLVNSAEADTGRWEAHTHNGIPHVYNSRVAWALLTLNRIDPAEKWVRIARSNLDFAVENLNQGWFDRCAFVEGVAPFTHTIAYAIRGLWEASVLLSDDVYRAAAFTVARSCMGEVRGNGFIPGQIGTDGTPVNSYACLTGNCQLSIIWAKMYKATGDEDFKKAATSSLEFVLRQQDVHARKPSIRGAVKGSAPIWGRYSPLTFPNWPTKFLVDALEQCRDWMK